MNNKKNICTNHQYCADKTDCPHSRLHDPFPECEIICALENGQIKNGQHSCKSIKFIRKQKLEKLNQIYEV